MNTQWDPKKLLVPWEPGIEQRDGIKSRLVTARFVEFEGLVTRCFDF